jgi:ubiquinone/menaquinone biosynthesis C-methylase UbiE
MPAQSAKDLLKRVMARIMRPGVWPLDQKLVRVDERVAGVDGRVARVEEALEKLSGSTIDREKHREELAYWRWLIKTEKGRQSLYAPFEVACGTWQRERIVELGQVLGVADVDAWCEGASVVEIGAGPYPAVAAAPRWRRAVAVDPLAKSYAEEGLLPAAADHVTYLEATGERIPLPAGFADLVIIENALDHVSDPGAVLLEIRRLLCEGGMLWLLVDLSNYSDHMHPHPFNEDRLRKLLKEAGFERITDRVSDHKSHPQAYGEYRGLLKKVPVATPIDPAVLRAAASVA